MGLSPGEPAQGLTAESCAEVGPTRFDAIGGELTLSNAGQRELLRGITDAGAALRTSVRGFSMTPAIRDGDFVTVVAVANRRLAVGDIVAFVSSGSDRLFLHRLVEQTADGWIARGDNCSRPDGLVHSDQVLGQVVRVERGGRDVQTGVVHGKRLFAMLSRSGVLARVVGVLIRTRRAVSTAARTITRCTR